MKTKTKGDELELQKFEEWFNSEWREIVDKYPRTEKIRYKNIAKFAWMARSNQGNSLEVILPEPLCRYADDSYKAYSRRQVETLLSELGVTIIEEEI